jgi:hypothetical protein
MDVNRRIRAMGETAPEPRTNLHLGRIALTRVKERKSDLHQQSGGVSITTVKGIIK